MIILELAHPNALDQWKIVDEFSSMNVVEEALRSPSFESFDGMIVRGFKRTKTARKFVFEAVMKNDGFLDVSPGSIAQRGIWIFNSNTQKFSSNLSLSQAWTACTNASWMLWAVGNTLPLDRLILWIAYQIRPLLLNDEVDLFDRVTEFAIQGKSKRTSKFLNELIRYSSENRIQEEHRLALRGLLHLMDGNGRSDITVPSSMVLARVAAAVMYDNNNVVDDLGYQNTLLDENYYYSITQQNFAKSLRDEFSLYDVTSRIQP